MRPLVSIITPTTKSREAFMRQLLLCVACQDYPNIEHIIIDNEGLTVGQKRNMACEKAKGEYIVHFDSDDIYSHDWVTKSVQAIACSNADVCGLRELYFFNYADGGLLKYVYSGKRNWIAGATMIYKRCYWEKRRFMDIQVGEDNFFISGDCKVVAHQNVNRFLASIHTENTSPRKIANSAYSLCNVGELAAMPLPVLPVFPCP